MASVIGTMGTGFLQNDAAWRELPRCRRATPLAVLLPPLGRGPARACSRASPRRSPSATISIARLLQHPNGDGAALHVVTHEARAGALDEALARSATLAEVHGSRCRSRSSPTAASRSSDGRDRRRLRRLVARRGLDAARPRAALCRARSARAATSSARALNPTGSFKDRGMVVAVAKAVERRRAGGRLRVDRATPPRRPPRTRRARASRRSC